MGVTISLKEHLPQIYRELLPELSPFFSGRFDLIGGTVYGSFSKAVHAIEYEHKDLDFLVHGVKRPLIIPGFETRMSGFGNPRLVGNDFTIDVVLLDNVHSIHRLGVASTRENYLSGVPLTVQSIGYDIECDTVFGAAGIKAVLEKTVAVNNPEEAEFEADRKGFNRVEEYIDSVAEKLGFFALYPRNI